MYPFVVGLLTTYGAGKGIKDRGRGGVLNRKKRTLNRG